MQEISFLVEALHDGYVARAIGESIFSQAEDMSTLREQVHAAVQCHFDEGDAPRRIRLHFPRKFLGAGLGSRLK